MEDIGEAMDDNNERLLRNTRNIRFVSRESGACGMWFIKHTLQHPSKMNIFLLFILFIFSILDNNHIIIDCHFSGQYCA